MQNRTLGNNGLATSAIGFGGMGLSQGYGPADDDSSTVTILQALERGVSLFDTAMSYGSGHNETLLGEVLGRERARVQIATKFGIVRDGSGVYLDGRPEMVRHYCDESLRRLGTDVIDLYYLHRVDPGVPLVETVQAMADLVTAGKVRHLGVSEVTVEQLTAAAEVYPITAVQFEWSLLWREPELELIPAARQLGIGIVPYSPLGRGLLTGTLDEQSVGTSSFRESDPRFKGAELTQNLRQVRALDSLSKERDCTTGQLALAWLLAQGDDVVPIPGTRRADRVAVNADAADIHLSGEDLRRLDDIVPPNSWVGDRRSFAVPNTVRTTTPTTSRRNQA